LKTEGNNTKGGRGKGNKAIISENAKKNGRRGPKRRKPGRRTLNGLKAHNP